MYPTSFIQEESQIHKDDFTDTLFIGMSNGESIILSGSYYFEVLKGTFEVLSIAFCFLLLIRLSVFFEWNHISCGFTCIR